MAFGLSILNDTQLTRSPPAKETIAQMVTFIWRSINKTMASMLKLNSNKLNEITPLLFVFPFAGLIITGGNPIGSRTTIETFPASSCQLPPFPDPGDL